MYITAELRNICTYRSFFFLLPPVFLSTPLSNFRDSNQNQMSWTCYISCCQTTQPWISLYSNLFTLMDGSNFQLSNFQMWSRQSLSLTKWVWARIDYYKCTYLDTTQRVVRMPSFRISGHRKEPGKKKDEKTYQVFLSVFCTTVPN